MTSINGISEFSSIPDAVQAFANGDFIVVLDSPDRENEGDLIIAAAALTPAKAAFMIRHTSGYLCAPITAPLAARLELPQMVAQSTDPHRTAYTISIDAINTSTGIGAHDRSLTCRTLADPTVQKEAFRRPGHIIPLEARDGGVLVRPGHTEATIDFCQLAGLPAVGVIGELVEDGDHVDGKAEMSGKFGMMRKDACLAFAKKYGVHCVTIKHLIEHLSLNKS